MADQGVRYVVTLQDINVASGLKNMESSALRAEAGVASLNDTLRSLAGALGVGFGVHALVSFGKDAVQGAADYETAIKRIKFASEDFADGARNINFIIGEADKFKIPLQEATDAYGKFLAMLNGSGIAGDQIRSLHDQLLLIGKVKGLGQGQLDAAVMNLGKMLESGSLDARHFRPLEQQLSGIGAFVAKELGISVHDLAVLRNKGKMTSIDPKVLLSAIEKQAASLEGFLPESLTTIQSGLNEVDNAWLKFKNDLVFDNRVELETLFVTLKDGIGYLREHKKDIESLGRAVIKVAEVWVGYKVAMGLANVGMATYKAFMAGYLGEQAAVVTATEVRAAAMNSLAASMERVAYASELMAQASLSGMLGLGVDGIPLASAGTRTAMGAGAAESGAVAAEAGVLGGVSVVSGALLVALAAGSIIAITHAMSDKGSPMKVQGGGVYDGAVINPLKGHITTDSSAYSLVKTVKDFNDPNGKTDTIYSKNKFIADNTGPITGMDRMSQAQRDLLLSHSIDAKDESKKAYVAAKKSEKFMPPQDKVTGSHVTNYNIDIKEINGIKQNTVQAGAKLNTEDVATTLRDVIVSIVNDSQIRGN